MYEALASSERKVISEDQTDARPAAGNGSQEDLENCELRRGRLEALPVADGELDAAVLFLVLHYVDDPAAVVAEARRALKPGGRLLVADMTPHDRAEYRQTMGHVWQGFAREQVAGWFADAGCASTRYT